MYFGLAGVTKNTFEVRDVKVSWGTCCVRSVSLGQLSWLMGNSTA